MGLGHIAAQIESDNRRKITQDTFGHLAAEEGRIYKGEMLFSQSEYGEYVVLRASFDGLDDSPWIFDAMNRFVEDHAKEAGEIYCFRGSVKNYEFTGRITRVSIR